MTNPAFVPPDGMKGIRALFRAVNQGCMSHERQEIAGRRTGPTNGRGTGVGRTGT
ncbi:hypothetical protein ACIBI9_52775 [Nonomuraea sp. NPDC050451]|uniref:hypothetical protein n=1 Tax=Nonomuraea sp. NPDC050451 TaxID=3364364 RepID=UPI0037A80AB4